MKHKCTDNFQKAFYELAVGQARPTYVLVLMQEFERRLERNPRYSLRAFARDLEMNLGHLSRVFRGERVPRRKTANRICQKLALSETDQNSFLESVAVQVSIRDKKEKAETRVVGRDQGSATEPSGL